MIVARKGTETGLQSGSFAENTVSFRDQLLAFGFWRLAFGVWRLAFGVWRFGAVLLEFRKSQVPTAKS